MSQLQLQHGYQPLPDGRRVHYLAGGRAGAAPVVLLHPSPMSSRFMRPVMEALAADAWLIAPDTPGYGLSDPLRSAQPGLAPYTQALEQFFAGLNLPEAILYGSSTGAQIAIEFAKAHPTRLRGVILDNAAHFENDRREAIVRDYFPARTPVADGSHLTNHWLNIRNLFNFFPWNTETPQSRLSFGTPPLEVMLDQLQDQLCAGEDYARAYRAAFDNENVAQVQPIAVPVRIVRWQGSMLRPQMQAFGEVQWPEHIQLMDCGPTPAERMQTIRAAWRQLSPGAPAWQPDTLPFADRLQQAGAAWSETGAVTASLHWRGRPAAPSDTQTVLLHDLGASSRQFAALLRPGVLAVDLPGHGLSAGRIGIGHAARTICGHLHELRATDLRLAGIGLGAAVAAELAALDIPCSRLLLVDALPPAPLPDMTVRWGGGHLLEWWHALRDRQLYRPWNERAPENHIDALDLNPARLHDELLDLLMAREGIADWHRRLSRFAWRDILAKIPQNTAFSRAHWRSRPAANAPMMPARIDQWTLTED